MVIWFIITSFFLPFIACLSNDIIVQKAYDSKTSISNRHTKTRKKKHHHKKKHRHKKKHTSHLSTKSTTYSTTISNTSSRITVTQTIPSSTFIVLQATETSTTDLPQLSHQPHTSTHRLALGLGLSFGCLSILILLCLAIYSYRKRKAMHRLTIQPDNGNFFAMPKPILDVEPVVHTKWRPTSFLGAVHLVVSKLPKSRSSGTVSESRKESSLYLNTIK